MLTKALALARKDLQIESGRKSLLTSLLFLCFILTFLSSFAIAYDKKVQPIAAATVIWLLLIFIAFQTLNRSLAAEEDSGCWDALCLCPISPRVIFLGKFIYNSLVIIFVQLAIFPFYLIFFNLKMSALLMLIPILLASIGFIGVGLLFALLSLKTPGREMALQTTSLPILLPALFLGLRATLDLTAGASLLDIWQYIAGLAAFDLFFIAIAYFAFDPKIIE